MNIVETYDLSKSFGRKTVVDQVNLIVPAGAVLGITGSSGAGKSTLLRLLATLTSPSAGDAHIAGFSVIGNPTRIRRMIGYMPQSFGAYKNMTVGEYIRFYVGCYGILDKEQPKLVDDLLQLVDLGQHANQKLNQLTRGMRKRLSLARALANDAQLLLLDEPFSDVDPRAHIEIRELIKELHHMGKTLVITARTPADFAGVCTDLAILNAGKLALSGPADVVLNRINVQRIINVKFFGNVETAVAIIRRSAGVEFCEIVSAGNTMNDSVIGDKQSLPAIVTVLKELRIGFTGSYDDASNLLRLLMRSGVQVVSYAEVVDDVGAPITPMPRIEASS